MHNIGNTPKTSSNNNASNLHEEGIPAKTKVTQSGVSLVLDNQQGYSDIEKRGQAYLQKLEEIARAYEQSGLMILAPFIKSIREGGDINTKDKNGNTALMWIANYNHVDILKLMLARSEILVNDTSKFGDTALMWAASNSSTESVKLLLAHPKILVNEKDENGTTALSWAVSRDSIEIVNLLLAHPTINLSLNHQGEIALEYAKSRKVHSLI